MCYRDLRPAAAPGSAIIPPLVAIFFARDNVEVPDCDGASRLQARQMTPLSPASLHLTGWRRNHLYRERVLLDINQADNFSPPPPHREPVR